MKKLLLTPLLLLCSVGLFAQIGSPNVGYTATTKYRKPVGITPSPLSRTQDSIFVFFGEQGKLTAHQSRGQAARFTWHKLDTATLIFNTIWIDSSHFSGNTSTLPDSVGYGYYRVTTDTLRSGARVPADTMSTWAVIDTFRIDSIRIFLQNCIDLSLQTLFYPNFVNGDFFWYFSYKYLDLWQTPSKAWRDLPDCSSCYIKKVAWTTSVDIYKDVDGDIDQSWKTQYNPYIPTPYYDARYKVEVVNYFGQKDTMSTGVIEARSTYAKMKLYVEKDKNGTLDWVEKTDEGGEESPATVKLVNASINAKDSASFTWSLFSNLYEQAEDVKMVNVPLIVPQIVTYDSATAVYPKDYDATLYQPGKYPIALYVVNKHGCPSSDTVTLEVDEFLINKEAIPTVFTPNGDGKNDEFKLKDPDQNAQSLESITINIFNRYGQLMYNSSDVLFSWDGKMRGTNTIAPDGVYFYVIKAQGLNKQRKPVKQTLKGSVHLFKGQ